MLDNTADPNYIEALVIIKAGSETLRSKPRADIPGFKMYTIDNKQQEKYTELDKLEKQRRQAIINAGK